MQKSELEKMLEEMIKAGAGHRATPNKILVSPTMFRAAEILLESRCPNYETEVKFDE